MFGGKVEVGESVVEDLSPAITPSATTCFPPPGDVAGIITSQSHRSWNAG
ncbi:pyrroline-5-carboxylate reductase [Aspergillus luchuensis]|uniref:Pyrroline-5-carboxylate reductase n=1 Tax=Aspergillus kawachii TaxID=1069201 RepID=A0A146FLR3_ASPKA|nr:pyrroline-5-carboxylate reductase [Aspergillus luchuensis]